MPTFRLRSAVPILPTPDVHASLEWFETHLGFTRIFVGDESGEVARDGVHLHFWRCEDPSIIDNTACRIEVTGIESLAEAIAASRALHPNGALAETLWGTREVTLLDPRRACITFYQREA